MEQLFSPKSIAIVGASRHVEKVGYQILNNLIQSGYEGVIYPVNPEADVIYNLKASPSLESIAGSIDLVIIAIPKEKVPKVLEEAVRKNIPYAIIISAGFAEAGEEGKLLQDEMNDVIIKASPIRVLGPNCLGLINSEINLNATFAAPKITKGNVSAVFQSGALGVALLDWAAKYEFGLSKFVSLGNKMDLDEAEILEYLVNDSTTKIVALYLEDIKSIGKFSAAAKNLAQQKPIIMLKGGTTRRGAEAAFSHTAALVNDRVLYKAIMSQSNIIEAENIEEMLALIQILTSEPPVKFSSLGIITNAGGPGILTTDAASRHNFKVPALSRATAEKVKNKISNISSINNPLDLAGEAKATDYEVALDAMLNDPEIASIIVLLTPQSSTEVVKTAEVIGRYAKSNKPIIASFMGGLTVEEGNEILRHYKVPHFEDPEEAVVALKKASKFWEKHFSSHEYIEVESNNQVLEVNYDALELVSNYDIEISPSGLATNMDVTMKIAGRVGFPVAVKNVSPEVVHKYKAGKVVLNVQSESFLKESVIKVGFPVLIQKMVEAPFEIIVGAKRDVELGIILTFGWGGVFVEDLQDISTRIAPLTEYDLDEMIRETKIGKILIREGVSLCIIKNIIISVNQIMADYPNIQEMDLNPIKVSANGAICVDARYK